MPDRVLLRRPRFRGRLRRQMTTCRSVRRKSWCEWLDILQYDYKPSVRLTNTEFSVVLIPCLAKSLTEPVPLISKPGPLAGPLATAAPALSESSIQGWLWRTEGSGYANCTTAIRLVF